MSDNNTKIDESLIDEDLAYKELTGKIDRLKEVQTSLKEMFADKESLKIQDLSEEEKEKIKENIKELKEMFIDSNREKVEKLKAFKFE